MPVKRENGQGGLCFRTIVLIDFQFVVSLFMLISPLFSTHAYDRDTFKVDDALM